MGKDILKTEEGIRILFVSFQIYPCKTGGTEVFNFHLADELSRSNKVILYTYCDKTAGNAELKTIRKGRPVKYLTPFKLFSYILKNRKDIDVIFLSYMRSHWFRWTLFPIIKKLFGIPYIITIHGGGLTPWKPFSLYRWAFVNADRLIGISERIKEEYQKRTGMDVKYIPPLFPFRKSENGQSEIKADFGLPPDSRVILYVGSLKKLKSPSTLLKAFDSLSADFIAKHNLYLIFAGEGPKLDKLIQDSENPLRTKLMGNVPRERMPDLFKISDLYVITSEFEGTPLSLLEAIFNMVPVIGSDVKGTNAIIENGKNGLLYQFGNHLELSKGIRNLLENRELSRTYAVEAEKTYSERYSFQKVLESYQKIFMEAIDAE